MPTKDRLQELLQVASSSPGPPPPPPPQDPDLEAMFQEVEHLRSRLEELEASAALVLRLHCDPTFHTNKSLQEQLDAAVARANACALEACGALRQFEARAGGGRRSARRRMAAVQYAAARRRYEAALARHHAALLALRDQRLLLLRDQLRLTNLTISDEECESLLDSKNLSLFVDNLQAETAEARRALRDAEARHDQLERIERSLRDVRDLMQQLAVLVAHQQDQIDSVEYYALQATEHVELGQQELLHGTVSRRRANKKKLGLVVCVVTGVAIVLLVLILT